MVRPSIASEIPRMTPKAFKTPTTSFAMVEIHAIETTKPIKQRRNRYLGGFSGVVVRTRIAKAMRDPRREYVIIFTRRRVFPSSLLAQTIIMTNRGAVKI
jgi:hypothetical protein